MSFNIEVESGSSVRLPTSGKYCDRDIIVTATGDNNAYDEGKQAEYDAFWNSVQQNGNKTDYAFAFAGTSWNDTTFKPKYDIIPSIANSMFQNSWIQNLVAILETQGVTLDTSNASTIQNFFVACPYLTKIPKIDASGVTSSTGCAGVLNSCTSLQEVEEFVFNGNATNYASFANWCTKLKKFKASGTIGSSISFEKSYVLDKESITSIITCLSLSASGQSVSFSKAAKEAAFTADEWAVLIATKSNWTISLV